MSEENNNNTTNKVGLLVSERIISLVDSTLSSFKKFYELISQLGNVGYDLTDLKSSITKLIDAIGDVKKNLESLKDDSKS